MIYQIPLKPSRATPPLPVLAYLLQNPHFRPKTQPNLRDQKLDIDLRRLSYCVCDERTGGYSYIHVCVGRGLESD
jgi:hypothetical protein